MTKVLITEDSLTNIANAIRLKLGVETTYTPAQMAPAISTIHGEPVNQEKTVTQNGEVTPDSGYDGLSRVIVNVSGGGGGGSTLITKTITENGTYNASSDSADGYSQVTVNVSVGDWNSTTAANTQYTGTYIAGNGSLSINNPNWPNQACIIFDLQNLLGRIIRIVNADGDRNFYNVFSSLQSEQKGKLYTDQRISTNGSLTFYADDFIGFGRFLVYDYTSDYQNTDLPTVSAWIKAQ